MSAPKTTIGYAFMAKVESTYGTYSTPVVGTDGVQLSELPLIQRQYGFDGMRPAPPGTGGTQVRTAPQGANYRPSFKPEAAGGGAAYSASVLPWNTHVFMRASGFDATGSFGGGVEKYTYTPTAVTGAPTSCSWEAYGPGTTATTGEKWSANGVYADMLFEVQNGSPGIFTFNTFGREQAAPSEVAWPTITYHPTVIPPVASPLVLTVNAVATHVCRSIKFALNRAIQERYPDQNVAGAHAGFHPGRRAPTVEFVIEAPLFATANYFSLWSAGTSIAASFQVGSTQYNRIKFTFAQMQITSAVPSNDGGVAILTVTGAPYCSTANLVDDISIVAD